MCVHTTGPTPPARALGSPAKAWATCPWHRAGGWHSYIWANPEWNQKQGIPDWELPLKAGPARSSHGAAPRQDLRTQSPQAQRGPGLQPRPAASGSLQAFAFPDQPWRSWGSGHSQAQRGGFTGADERVGTHHPTFPGPQHFPKGRINAADTEFPKASGQRSVQMFPQRKKQPSQGFRFLEANPGSL